MTVKGFKLWTINYKYLCNSPLHDEKMRVIYIQLNWSKEVLNSIVLNIRAINKIFVFATNNNLIEIF